MPTAPYSGACLYWPNKMARTYMLALEDVMGRNGIKALLNRAGLDGYINDYPPDNLDLLWSFQNTSAIRCAIDEVYGTEGGKGIAVRAGRAWFHHAVRDFGAVLGIGGLAFRLLPSDTKVKLCLNAMADTFNKTSDQVIQVVDEDQKLLYQIGRCPECWGRSANKAICHTALGLLQEALHWVARGIDFQVDEVECIAKGDPSCTYLVQKRPRE